MAALLGGLLTIRTSVSADIFDDINQCVALAQVGHWKQFQEQLK